MKIVKSEEAARIDREAQERFNYPSAVLMENAGIKAQRFLIDRLWNGEVPSGLFVYVAGKGNNGGDALVMARQAYLEGKREIAVVLVSERMSGDAAANRDICGSLGIPLLSWNEEPETARALIDRARVIFDGISGTGIRGALRQPASDVVDAVNASDAECIAIDIPSGLGDDYREGFPVVAADVTLTMGLPKLALYRPKARAVCGDIHVIRIGFPPVLTEDPSLPFDLLDESALAAELPPFPDDVYKNKRGTVAVFAGSPGTTGAAELCSTAALRSRAGLVTVYADDRSYLPLASRLMSVMVRAWDPGSDPSSFDPERYSALLVGPGWGTDASREPWLEAFLGSNSRGVLDADAVKLLGRLRKKKRFDLGGRWILTPHPGEFHEAFGTDKETLAYDPFPAVLEASSELNAVVVLKGHVTCVASPDGKLGVLDGMNPALGTGGSGDVLAGVIAGLFAGGMEATDAARFGVTAHSLAGRLAFREKGWFLAEDLLPFVSRVLKTK